VVQRLNRDADAPFAAESRDRATLREGMVRSGRVMPTLSLGRQPARPEHTLRAARAAAGALWTRARPPAKLLLTSPPPFAYNCGMILPPGTLIVTRVEASASGAD